ncbi:LOW QUALITY PROTEIN: inhibin beta C chain [Molothrus ater]|uniref:LOW QUALITY PROTEIN: inhibin beta C chain n=1 Tax=Molothrus ater TaxID=84834 RepID=UPI00174B0A96|nr:LOW QUALITY PROTEIN: inhibin beta C chain [Molothrus ater]
MPSRHPGIPPVSPGVLTASLPVHRAGMAPRRHRGDTGVTPGWPRCPPRAAPAPSAPLHLNRSGRSALPGRLRRSSGAFISPGISQYLWPRQEENEPGAPGSLQFHPPAPVLLLGRCSGSVPLSPPATGMPLPVVLLLLSLPRMAAAKGGRCPVCGVASLAPGAQRDALLALAKQSILAKLRLPGRPGAPRPPSRGSLLTALRTVLRDGAATAGMIPGMLRDAAATPGMLGTGLQEFELLSFAESGSSTSRSVRLHFRFSPEVARSAEVQQATLYLFWTSPGPHPVTVRLLQPDPAGPNLTVTSEARLEVQGPGWTTLDVAAAVQSLFTQDTPRLTVHLELPEHWASPLPSHQGHSHLPFVVAKAHSRAPHRVRRRGVDCGADSRMCCRREFFVDFKEIGWEDWIIQPEGYHMNYCSGLCPLHMAGIPGLAASFHTAVLSRIKAASAAAAVDSCCVPTQRRPLSLLYYDRDSNIVKTDIPDMIVESCGCT